MSKFLQTRDIEFFKGYIVSINGNKVTRCKSKLSRFYFDRLNNRISLYKKELFFEKELQNAIDNRIVNYIWYEWF